VTNREKGNRDPGNGRIRLHYPFFLKI